MAYKGNQITWGRLAQSLKTTITNILNSLTNHEGVKASTEALGHVKVDGKTIVVDPETGVASAIASGAVKLFTGDLNTLVEKGTYLVTKDSTNKPWIYDIVVEVLPNYDGSIVWQQARVNQAGANNAIIIKRVGSKNGDSFTWLALPKGTAGSLDGWAITNPPLDDTLTSSSLTSAATANAVKQVNDKVNSLTGGVWTEVALNVPFVKENIGAEYKIVGKRVTIRFRMRTSTSLVASSNYTICTLPAEYRPSGHTVCAHLFTTVGAVDSLEPMYIHPVGVVTFKPSKQMTVDSSIAGQITYEL